MGIMIYTVTFNPAIDYIVNIDKMVFGITNRSIGESYYYGGKGINVSTILSNLGLDNVALGFVAGFTGDAIEKGAKEAGIKTDFIHLDEGISRINIKIKGAEETEINCQGPNIKDNDIEKLFAQLEKLKKGDTLILAGSIPNSLPQDIYEKILSKLSDKGIRFVVDATQKLLMNVLKYKPFLIKPNKQELSEMFSVEVKTQDDIIKYGKKLQEMGAVNVLVSLGGDGALLIDEFSQIHTIGVIKGSKIINTVGSGDSMVAGFVAGYMEKNDYDYALKLGTVCGCATAMLPGLATKAKINELLGKI
jgi:1-phosphofructokinase